MYKSIAKASEMIPHAGVSVFAMQLPALLDKGVVLLFSYYEEHQCNRTGNTPAGPLSCKKKKTQARHSRAVWPGWYESSSLMQQIKRWILCPKRNLRFILQHPCKLFLIYSLHERGPSLTGRVPRKLKIGSIDDEGCQTKASLKRVMLCDYNIDMCFMLSARPASLPLFILHREPPSFTFCHSFSPMRNDTRWDSQPNANPENKFKPQTKGMFFESFQRTAFLPWREICNRNTGKQMKGKVLTGHSQEVLETEGESPTSLDKD